MMKCDFCELSTPNGKCFYSTQVVREKYCKNAINTMVEAFGKSTKTEEIIRKILKKK